MENKNMKTPKSFVKWFESCKKLYLEEGLELKLYVGFSADEELFVYGTTSLDGEPQGDDACSYEWPDVRVQHTETDLTDHLKSEGYPV
jgi:hypothetical protein